MALFSLTKKAKEDFRNIAIFTEKRWGKKQRNIYIKQFDDTFHYLAELPQSGKECDFIRKGYRKYPQGSHLIFYQILDKNKIEIIRIIHKQMDISLQF